MEKHKPRHKRQPKKIGLWELRLSAAAAGKVKKEKKFPYTFRNSLVYGRV